jgi:hypothetical protein
MKHNAMARVGSILLLTAALASCGGGHGLDGRRGANESPAPGATQPGGTGLVPRAHFDPSLLTPQPARTFDPAALATPAAERLGGPAGREVSAANLGSLLPPLPDDSSLARQASVAYTDQADPASPVAKSSNVTTGGGSATLTSVSGVVSWAYYGIPITGTKTPATLQVMGTMLAKANGFKSGIYIGLADYSLGRWVIQPSVFNLTTTASVPYSADNYKSPGKRLYILVATFNGDVAQITGVQTTGDDSNVAPTAALTSSPQVAYTPGTFTFDASATSDSDGIIEKYEFDFGDGGGFVDNGSDPIAPHAYAAPGNYTCQVRVTDDGGLSGTAQTVVISVAPGSFLPLAWYQARINAGLGAATMGEADMFGPGSVFPNFFFTDTYDMRTKLPGYFDGWYTDPEGYPVKVKAEGDLIANAAGLQDLLLDADAQFDTNNQITRQDFNPVLDPVQPLAKAVADFVDLAGGVSQQSVYEAAVVAMPLPQQNALARVVVACTDALDRRNQVNAALGLTAQNVQDLFNGAHGCPLGGVMGINTGQFIPLIYNVTQQNFWTAGFPYSDAYFLGSAEITDAVDQLTAFQQTNPIWVSVNLGVDTPAGRIEITGTGSDTHTAPLDGNGHAILIDLGGSDTYDCHAGGTASGVNGVAVCLDLAGNDIYNRLDDPNDVDRTQNPSNDNTSQQGAGRQGIGILVDYSGNDAYHSVRMSQGSCVFGVGMLADLAGDDTYDMEALGQGGAFGGIGVLYDKTGTDTYLGWNKVQGAGSLMGIGLLVDQGPETDSYTAVDIFDPAKPEYDLTNTLDHNVSFAQGCAVGLPRGALNGGTPQLDIVGGGGYGLLYDGGGTDSYACGIFGQASAFYQCAAVLLDRGGDDTYSGFSSVQGTAVTAGLACLMDSSGTDHYTVTDGPGIGVGANIAIGWLFDLQGADVYNVASIGMGGSTTNGCGYCLDYAGADTYNGHGGTFQNQALGRAGLGGGDATAPAYGIFVDNGGTDTYAPPYATMTDATLGLPGNNKAWVRTVEGAYLNGRGSGIDVGP